WGTPPRAPQESAQAVACASPHPGIATQDLGADRRARRQRLVHDLAGDVGVLLHMDRGYSQRIRVVVETERIAFLEPETDRLGGAEQIAEGVAVLGLVEAVDRDPARAGITRRAPSVSPHSGASDLTCAIDIVGRERRPTTALRAHLTRARDRTTGRSHGDRPS